MNQSTLTAKVGANVLTKVTRLFDGSPKTIFNELVQNSRRAGSQKLEVTLKEVGDRSQHTEVIFRDYGVGVENLDQVLTLSDSGWKEPTTSDEDPAGMGIFVLSSLKDPVIISSGGFEWTLTQGVFQGLEQATVSGIALFGKGLEVRFTLRDIGLSQVSVLLASAVRYANIAEVTVNGDALESGRYVADDDLLAEDLALGVRLEINRVYATYASILTCGFHGLTVQSPITDFNLRDMCSILKIDLRLEILHSRNIKLVLPARNALVTEGLDELWKWLTARVFEYVASSKSHKLPYAYGRQAADYGITLPPLDLLQALKFWQGSKQYELDHETRKNRKVALVKFDESTAEIAGSEQLLGNLESADSPYLYAKAASASFSGYPEYDSLPCLEASVVYPEGNKIEGDITIVDDLRLVINDDLGAEIDSVDLPAVFTGDGFPTAYLDDLDFGTVVQKEHLDPIKLAEILNHYGYSYNDDSDSSDEDLRAAFRITAEKHFFSHLMSPADAMKHAVTKALDDLLAPDWNHGNAWGDSLTIRVDRVTTEGPYGNTNSIKTTFELQP
jgi:hypothetical protein